MLSFSMHANAKDDQFMFVAPCMVKIVFDDEEMYLNTMYIRTVSSNPRLVTVGMASNYDAKGKYYMKVNSAEEGKVVVRQIIDKINSCRTPR